MCDHSFNPYKGKFFVNIYHVSLSRGGPEEGGWWYDVGEFLRCSFVSMRREEAVTARNKLSRRWADKVNEGSPPKHSVVSSGVYEVHVDEYPGHDFPEVRPHYC